MPKPLVAALAFGQHILGSSYFFAGEGVEFGKTYFAENRTNHTFGGWQFSANLFSGMSGAFFIRRASSFTAAVARVAAAAAVASAASFSLILCEADGQEEGARQLSFAAEVDEQHELLAQDNSRTRLIFLGTGSSSGTPIGFCLTEDSKENERCAVAHKALALAPHKSKNHRLNPCILVHHVTPDRGDTLVQIDVGKTFREAIVRW